TRSRFRLLILGAVKRDVRAAQYLDFAWTILRKKRDADADPNVMLQRSGGDRLVELLDHAQRWSRPRSPRARAPGSRIRRHRGARSGPLRVRLGATASRY